MADDQLEYVLSLLKITKRRGDKAECLCPAHDDHHASLSVSRGTEQPVVLHCHAGCTPENIMAAVGLTIADLVLGTPRLVTTYYYQDLQGNFIYAVERWVPKTFRPKLPSGAYARPHPADEVLYRLPELRAAIEQGQTVYLVEGERDVETAHDFGLTATTAMSGADQRWLPQFTEQLKGAKLVIVADNDERGRLRARRLLDELHDSCVELRAAIPRYGKDLSDHLLAGYSLDLLDPLPAAGQLVRYRMSQVVTLPINWAWKDWIPAGMLSIIEGDPGEGKSVLTCDLAARWSVGANMPDDSVNPFGGPVPVGMVSAEDDASKVIRPRIQVAGGVPDRIVMISGMPIVGARYLRSLDLESDVEALREAIEQDGLRVLILDPLMAFLGNTRTAIDNEVRKVLTPLRYLAEETGCAILAVRHLRKAGGKAVHAGGGSIAFTGAARSVMVVSQYMGQRNQRVLAMTKSNVGAEPHSLAYHVEPETVAFFTAARITWDGETSVTAADLMQIQEAGSVTQEVRDAVLELLGVQSLTFADIRKQLLLMGVEHGEKTLHQVLRAVAASEREGKPGPGAIYKWHLKPDLRPTVEPDEGAQTTDEEPPANKGGLDSSSQDEPAANSTSEGEVPGAWWLVEPIEPGTPEPPTSKGITKHQAPSTQPPVGNDQPPSTQPPVGETPANKEGLPDYREPVTAYGSDEVIACAKCGRTEPLVYFESVQQWRCEDHPPAL